MGRATRRISSAVDLAGKARTVMWVGSGFFGGGAVVAAFKNLFDGVPNWVLGVMLVGIAVIAVGGFLAAAERRSPVHILTPELAYVDHKMWLVTSFYVTNGMEKQLRLLRARLFLPSKIVLKGSIDVIDPEVPPEVPGYVDPGVTAVVRCYFPPDGVDVASTVTGDLVLIDQFNRRHLAGRVTFPARPRP